MTNPVPDQVIVDVSRDLVAQIAPQELPVFRANSQAYFKDPEKALKGQASKDQMLGFGLEGAAVFLTPVVLAVVTEAVKFVLMEIKKAAAAESASVANDLVKYVFKKFRPIEQEATKTPPPLLPEQVAQVREVAFEKARQLQLSEAQAGLLADSLIGSLVITTT